MTELPYPYTITHGHEPTPPLQTAIEKINVYSSQYAHLSPSECAALRKELKRLKDRNARRIEKLGIELKDAYILIDELLMEAEDNQR